MARCADCISTRCRMQQHQPVGGEQADHHGEAERHQGDHPGEELGEEEAVRVRRLPMPVSMIAAQSAASADAISRAHADRDGVAHPPTAGAVRTVAAFLSCCARAICSSIVSRRRTTGRPLLPHPVRTGGAYGSVRVVKILGGLSNHPGPAHV